MIKLTLRYNIFHLSYFTPDDYKRELVLFVIRLPELAGNEKSFAGILLAWRTSIAGAHDEELSKDIRREWTRWQVP